MNRSTENGSEHDGREEYGSDRDWEKDVVRGLASFGVVVS